MIKGDYIEYEFDLYSIKNEDVIENFKKRFGSIITKKGLHYEIYEIDNDKMSGGSESTFPYNKFEETLDILIEKKNELSNDSKTLYESLFSDFKDALENNIAEKKLDNNNLSTQNEEKLESETFLPEEKVEDKPEEDDENKPEEDATKTIIHVKLIVQHMKKLIDLEDIKKGKNL
jgi:hypothetical protein